MSDAEERVLRKFLIVERKQGKIGLTKAMECDASVLKELEKKEYIVWDDMRIYLNLTPKAAAILEG